MFVPKINYLNYLFLIILFGILLKFSCFFYFLKNLDILFWNKIKFYIYS